MQTTEYHSIKIPLKPSGYVSGKYFVLTSPETNRSSVITSRSKGTLCVTPVSNSKTLHSRIVVYINEN